MLPRASQQDLKIGGKNDTERYLSTGELMDILSISRSTVYRLMA